MNKWTLRLIGLLIALVLGLVIFDGWFTPEIPPALQQDISLEVNGESQTITPAPLPPVAPPADTAPPQPAFALESLNDDNSTPQPVLSNPGSDKAKAREAAPIAANQKTVAKNTARRRQRPRCQHAARKSQTAQRRLLGTGRRLQQPGKRRKPDGTTAKTRLAGRYRTGTSHRQKRPPRLRRPAVGGGRQPLHRHPRQNGHQRPPSHPLTPKPTRRIPTHEPRNPQLD